MTEAAAKPKRTPKAPVLHLEVTEELIKEAVPRDSSHCMIAEAVKAAYPDAQAVAVDLQTIRFSDRKKGKRYTYLTPRLAQVAIVKWDQGLLPDPFSIRIRGGHVTQAGKRAPTREITKDEREKRSAAGKRGQAQLNKTRLVERRAAKGDVPDRVGGKTPPLSPHSRRRAFGLRGLAL